VSEDSLNYTSIEYTTSDTSDYRALQQRLDNLTAQINAYQKNLRNQGSGGFSLSDLFGGGLGGMGATSLLGIVIITLVGIRVIEGG
jgi:hypothetical protein